MKNKNLFIVGLLIAAIIAIGGLAYLQGTGNMFQGALLPRYTTSSTSTVSLDSLNREIELLKSQVNTLNQTQTKIKSTTNSLIDQLRIVSLPQTCQGLVELNDSLDGSVWPNFTVSTCTQMITNGLPAKL